MSYKRKTELELVRGEEKSLPELGEVRELVKELSESEQETVIKETQEFYRARQVELLGNG